MECLCKSSEEEITQILIIYLQKHDLENFHYSVSSALPEKEILFQMLDAVKVALDASFPIK
jgi:hypothetical protein